MRAMNARKAYPLDADEERALLLNTILSQLLFLAIGLFGACVVAGLASGDWTGAFLGMGWARAIGASLCALPAPTTIVCGVALSAAMFALNALVERCARRAEAGREAVAEARRGIDGELPRLPLPALFATMALVGACEELLFRFALLGGLWRLFALAVPLWLAGAAALLFSSFVFWLLHVRYRDAWSSLLTLAFALILGTAFMTTGSLGAVAIAHGLYDLAATLAERERMRRDPDYFCGPAPRRVLMNEIEREPGAPIPREDGAKSVD